MTSGFEDEDDDQSKNDKQKQENTAPPPSIFLIPGHWHERDTSLMIRKT